MNSSVWTVNSSLTGTTTRIKVDLEVITAKGYSILLKVPGLNPQYQIQFIIIYRTLVGRGRVLSLRSQCILHTQSSGWSNLCRFYSLVECSPMVRETWVQSQVASTQRLQKWYLIPPGLTLSNIRCVSRVKWSNPEKGVAPSPTPRCSSYWKGSLRVALDYSRQLLCLTIWSIVSLILHLQSLYYKFVCMHLPKPAAHPECASF